jgi:hypothetical protein
MKKIYVRPVLETYSAEMGQMVCASYTVKGVVGQDGDYEGEKPNKDGMPDFGGYIDDDDEGPASTAKVFDLWGDW